MTRCHCRRCMSGFTDAFYEELTSFYKARALSSKPAYYNTAEEPSAWFPPLKVGGATPVPLLALARWARLALEAALPRWGTAHRSRTHPGCPGVGGAGRGSDAVPRAQGRRWVRA